MSFSFGHRSRVAIKGPVLGAVVRFKKSRRPTPGPKKTSSNSRSPSLSALVLFLWLVAFDVAPPLRRALLGILLGIVVPLARLLSLLMTRLTGLFRVFSGGIVCHGCSSSSVMKVSQHLVAV